MKLALHNTAVAEQVHRAAMSPRPATGELVIRSRSGSVLHTAPPPVVSALRYTVAKLLLEDKNGVPRRLGVTAALSGEGVSYVSRSLAAVLANDGEQSVCLVELNWWSQSADGARPGVAEVLRGDAGLHDVLVPTDQPRLVLLPAGAVAGADRAALARSTALPSFLDELSMYFPHLVLDLPALLVTSDALTLAGYTEACTLVVRQGVTPAHAVRRALEHVERIRMLGIVLNRTSTRLPRLVTRWVPQS